MRRNPADGSLIAQMLPASAEDYEASWHRRFETAAPYARGPGTEGGECCLRLLGEELVVATNLSSARCYRRGDEKKGGAQRGKGSRMERSSWLRVWGHVQEYDRHRRVAVGHRGCVMGSTNVHSEGRPQQPEV